MSINPRFKKVDNHGNAPLIPPHLLIKLLNKVAKNEIRKHQS